MHSLSAHTLATLFSRIRPSAVFAIVSLACVLCVSCSSLNTVEGVSPTDFPPGLEFPTTHGDAHAVVETVCNWATRSSVAFRGEAIRSVFVEKAEAPGQRITALSVLLPGFATSANNPQSLVAEIDPREIQYTDTLQRIASLIPRRGLWLLSKATGRPCEAREVNLTVMSRGGPPTLCLSAHEVTAVPMDMARADYRMLDFAVIANGSSGPRQRFDVQTLTLTQSGRMIGRTVSVWALSMPGETGTVQNICPAATAVTFESVGEAAH